MKLTNNPVFHNLPYNTERSYYSINLGNCEVFFPASSQDDAVIANEKRATQQIFNSLYDDEKSIA